MEPIIHISRAVIYQYQGWLFEFDRNKPIGPRPLKKDHEPRQRAGRKFYKMFGSFFSLSKEEQEAHRVA